MSIIYVSASIMDIIMIMTNIYVMKEKIVVIIKLLLKILKNVWILLMIVLIKIIKYLIMTAIKKAVHKIQN